MHERSGAHHFPSVRFANRLVTKTNAEDWNRFAPPPDGGYTDPGFGRRARARGDHHARHTHSSDVINRYLVVALDDGIFAKLSQILDEIVGERIVVIEYEEHR